MAFNPPAASMEQLDGVPFGLAVDFAVAERERFGAFDARPGNRDPSKCKALLKFPDHGRENGAVFWSSKMAIDADGPAAGPGRRNGKEMDPDNGQNDTSLKLADGTGLPSEVVPYIVLPMSASNAHKTFDPAVAIGDVAVVIFKNKIAPAICGDIGPANKIGEASIRVHEILQQSGCPDPCERRDAKGFCERARNASVEQDVLFFVFPDSAFNQDERTLEAIDARIRERAFALYAKLRGRD
jgi:hypothetical protein